MVLLELITLGMAAYGIAGMVSSSKTALIQKRIEERGDLDVERDFEDILDLNRVYSTIDLFTDEKGVSDVSVLPENGWVDCLETIRKQPLTTEADEKKFIQLYNQKRKEGLERRKQYFEDNYQKYKRMYYMDLNEAEELVTFTFRKEHFITPSNHSDFIKNMYNNTFFGQMATKPGKLIFKEHMGRYVPVEVWQLTLPSKFSAEMYYKACSKRLGVSGI